MASVKHDTLLHNVKALIEGLQPQVSDGEIAQIHAAIWPTYEHVRNGGNMAEIVELNRILEEMNGIVLRYKSIKHKMKQFNEMRERARAASPVGLSTRLAIIDMILYNDVWLSEKARLEGARNIESRARKQYAADEAFHNSDAQVAARADTHLRQEAKALDDATAAAGAAAGAAEAEERRNLAASMGDEVYADEMAGQIMAIKKLEASREKKWSKRKGGKKSHKRSNKKGGKKRSHRRRRH
jgi:hypothetical protein